ncbi:MAG: NADPH:quinone oxidoreductase family protein, partial [Cellvibrionaceae bacterium]|nr:NADPH:quinone oxidoreductase family protein [Cellvibrionaceae bacterium]
MKAIICNEFGPLEQLQYQEVDSPQVSPGTVLLDIKAAGVNYPDGLMVQGLYQMKPPFPFTPGSEVAAVVKQTGEGVSNVKVGDRVIGFVGLGGYAEQALCPATHLIPLPDGIGDAEAAGLTTAHATAHHALKQRANIQPGETLLVTGAAGGTGLAAVQIGKAMGATVIAACSTEEKLQMAKDNGADILINYAEKDLKTELKALNEGRGIDVVYDTVGGDAFDAASRCMAWNGRLLVIGFASGTIPQFPVNLSLVKG